MKAQGYKAQKAIADSRPQPHGLDIDFTFGRRTGSVGVSPRYVSGRPRWAGNTRSQPSLRFPVIYEPVMAVAVPKCSVCALPTRRMRHPVVVTKLLSKEEVLIQKEAEKEALFYESQSPGPNYSPIPAPEL